MTFGSTSLSTQQLETSDGEKIYKPANTYEESQDYAIKQRLLEQVDEVKRNKGNKYGQLLEVVSESLFIDRAAPVFEERNFFEHQKNRNDKI